MTTKERMKLLTEWKEQFEKCDQAWTALEKIFRGLDCDSQIGDAIWRTQQRYTEAVGKLIGDDNDWLDWYCYDNNMGADGKKAKAAKWKRLQPVDTLGDLCRLIEAGME